MSIRRNTIKKYEIRNEVYEFALLLLTHAHLCICIFRALFAATAPGK